jgi:hypothetical protein
MSKVIVRFISCILLVGFLGFLVPMNNWHEYAHKHTKRTLVHHSDGLSIDQGIEKCVFCDLQLLLFFHETNNVYVSWISSFDFLFTDWISAELPVREIHLLLRGPPVNDLF